MSSHVIVLRSFSGLTPGQVVDTSDWLHTKSLEEDRYVKTIDSTEVGDTKDCECGVTYLPAARLHDCAVIQEAKAEKLALKKAAAESASTAALTPPAPSKTTSASTPA